MNKILFVYGYNSSPSESSTYKNLKSTLNRKYEVECIEYSQSNPTLGLETIKEYLKNNKDIKCVVGTSLGAFFVMSLGSAYRKILINPCMYPSKELKKLGCEFADIYKELEDDFYNNDFDTEDYLTTFGIFGNHDELFSYKELFKSIYKNNFVEINSGHAVSLLNIKNDIVPQVEKMINKNIYEQISNQFGNIDIYLEEKDRI